MKQKVRFSKYSIIITAGILLLFVVGLIALIGETKELVIFSFIFGIMIISGLYYCPVSVEANGTAVILHRMMSSPKVFPLDKFQSVDTCYPSAGGIKLCGSGGFMGYWGYFNDIMIGTYFGYYGSRSNCILIKMKDGKQYILGCGNPMAMVNYLKSQMKCENK